MKTRRTLTLESLEARETPASFGNAWPDGSNLTLSVAPDGTSIATGASDLAAALAASPTANMDVLRAFQTWAQYANVNFGLVADHGQAFGTPGAVQGDSRFGDIRVGGLALPADVLAVTAPYAQYDSYAGNVVLNTALTGPYDLYTILLQEAGHSLGIGNSPDTTSAMYEFYQGARTGLSAGDIAAVRGLYGARSADKYEGATGNGTRQTSSGFLGTITGDITTAADVDVYKFTTGLLANRIDIDLRAEGLSLLTGRVELLDWNGNVVATASATDPTNNDLSLTLTNPQALRTYYVRVSAATTGVFGIGSYEVDVVQNSVATGLVNGLLNETGLNDTLFTATSLLSDTLTVGNQTEFNTDARLASSSDVDYYSLLVPANPTGGAVNLVATVWGKGGESLNAWVEVRDVLGRLVPSDVLTADGRTTTIQVRDVTPGGLYFVRVASDTGTKANYHLAADVTATTTTPARGASGTLTAANASTTGTLTVAMSGQVHFILSADGGGAELTVTAADGTVVTTFTVAAGRGRSVDVWLAAGNYQVKVRRTSGASMAFDLGIKGVTDPVGARAKDSTGGPATGGSTGSGSSSGGTSNTGPSNETQPSWYTPPSSADNARWY